MSVNVSPSPEMGSLPGSPVARTLTRQFHGQAPATRRRTEYDGGQAHRIRNLNEIRIRPADSR